MRQLPTKAVRSGIQKTAMSAPGPLALARVTIFEDVDHLWVIDSIIAGYDDTPATAGILLVRLSPVGSPVYLWRCYVPTKGMRTYRFRRGLYTGNKNDRLVVTLSSGGAGVSPALTVTYR